MLCVFKSRRALLETSTVKYALKKWKWIETGQPELWICEYRYEEVLGDILCNIEKLEPCLDRL